jgi:hypothetical protein
MAENILHYGDNLEILRKAPSGKDYPRIQLLTIVELLKGKKVDCPISIKSTFKKAMPNKEKKQRNMMFTF